MESTNLQHQQQQKLLHDDHQFLGSSSSSSSSSPSCTSAFVSSPYLTAGSSHPWTSLFHLNSGNSSAHTSSSEALLLSSELNYHQKDDPLSPPCRSTNSSMYQNNISFPWPPGDNLSSTFISPSSLDLLKIKDEEELNPETPFPKFTDLLTSSSSNSSSLTILQEEHHHRKEDEYDEMNHVNHDLNEKLLLKTVSPNFGSFHQLYAAEGRGGGGHVEPSYSFGISIPPLTRGHFSQILPSVNISSLRSTNAAGYSNLDSIRPSSSCNSMQDMNNLQALDLFSPSRLPPSSDGSTAFGMDHTQLQYTHDKLRNSRENLSSLNNNNGVVELAERSSSNNNNNIMMDPKVAPEHLQRSVSTSKRPRIEPRASCPPFKVKKEKLGDRIATLQQLVAPFGKTDTASVLMEAIGYIKFLQNQVETLSVPYMKQSGNKGGKTTDGVSDSHEDQQQSDLRSRGLCLVPLSCLSYITNVDAGGGGYWPTPTFSPSGF